ncbi:penicillin acylase family protein [Gephyromycinifex aptenodytis]|uniref:penicillin acylase family protein n=1 Tax=Gephyromycinifex aptenodytis TaxID=2716227 RepID=UPI001B2FF799|nr:penicillin acylase family protein [Gephyromycinifex aptenodytis]
MATRIARRLLKALGVALCVVLVLAFGAVSWLRVVTPGQDTGQLQLTGLSGDVTVTRDAWGVPHIRAEHDADVYFALGVVHWQDRAWQMDVQRRITQGRLSEILGEAALTRDEFLRTMGFQRAAESALPALSQQSRAVVAAYTAGVNAGMSLGRPAPEFRILGYTPQPWTEVDSIAWSKLMAYDLGGNYVDEILGAKAVQRFGPSGLDQVSLPYPKDGPTVLSAAEIAQAGLPRGAKTKPQPAPAKVSPGRSAAVRDPGYSGAAVAAVAESAGLARFTEAGAELGMVPEPGKGSNNWVLSGAHTASGKPLLADDPHLGLPNPMLWYLAELHGPGVHSIGATIPGLSAVVIGRNDTIAWGVTNTGPDVQDLYVEPADAPLRTRVETIGVKGKPDVHLTVAESRHGPIISGIGAKDLGERVALRWTALDPGDTTLDAFIGINTATSWEEFREAMRHYVAPSQNFVYADVTGKIGYLAPGRIPIRHWPGTLPVPGDGNHEWSGYIPFEELPQVLDPGDGMVVTANNQVPPDSYRHTVANPRMWAEPHRATRILQLLRGRSELTVDDMSAIQLDTRSLAWEQLRAPLLATAPADAQSAAALEQLRDWDGVQDLDSVAASLYEAWLVQLRAMAQDEFGPDVDLRPSVVAANLQRSAPVCADEVAGIRDCPELLTHTLAQAIQSLREQHGSDQERWAWGRVHQLSNRHTAFADIPVLGRIFGSSWPAAGGTNTVNVARPYDAQLQSRTGPGYRQIIDLSDMNASRYVGVSGQGGSPFHPHHTDQLQLHQQGRYLPMSTDPADWGSVRTLRLSPPG